MSEDIQAITAAATGGHSLWLALLTFFGVRYINKVDKNCDDLARHEKEDAGKYVTVDQLTRVHSRLDDVSSKADRILGILERDR